MIFADILKKPRSRGRLSSDTASTSHQSSLASLSTEAFTFMNPISSSPPPLVPKKDKKEKGWQLKGRAPSNASPTTTVTPLAHQDGEWKVDFVMSDLDQMDGIVKPLPDPKDAVPSNGHPSSPVDSSTSSTFCNSLQQPPSPPPSSTVVFNNPHPFSSTSPVNKPNGVGDIPKLSPKSTPLLIAQEESGPSRMAADGPVPPIWTAPESWAVEKDEEEQADAGGASSSEESTNISTRYTDAMSSLSSADPTSRRKSRRKTIHLRKISPRNNTDRVRVRIYRADGSYHVAPISVNSTVAELTPSLNQKLLPHQERETHKLYLKERGRGKFTAVRIVSFVFLIHTRACIGAYGEAGCYCHPTVAAGRLRPSGQSCFSWRRRHDVSHEVRI
jgi:adenylate cyclase